MNTNTFFPEIFSCLNALQVYHHQNQKFIYHNFVTKEGSRASDCIQCGQCEKICPQHLPVREYLKDAVRELEN